MKKRIEDEPETRLPGLGSVTRREFVSISAAGASAALILPVAAEGSAQQTPSQATFTCNLKVNGQDKAVEIDTRTTLLDLLRENLQMPGTKKGCDHGQCGACTVLVNGKRINSCLSLAAMNDGQEITTIEGLASDGHLHPMQVAFVEYDALQCGYCTPGQICSAVAMLQEARRGAPSAVTGKLAQIQQVTLTDDEIRERMSGNICRCGAYAGIVAAIRSVDKGEKHEVL